MSTATSVLSATDRAQLEKKLTSIGRSAATSAVTTLIGVLACIFSIVTVIVVTVAGGDATGSIVMSFVMAIVASANLYIFVTTTQKHRTLVAQLYSCAHGA